MPAAYVVGDEPIPGYRLLGFLGRGGFGEVWKASAPGGAHVALKIIELHGKRGAKEFRALQLVKNIRHPNLVQVTAFWMKNAQGEILDETIADAVTVAEVEAPADAKETLDIQSIEQARAFPAELIIAMGLGDKSLADRLTECQQQGLEGIPGHELLDYMEQAARAIDFLNSPRHDLGAGPVSIQHRDIKPQNILIVGDAVQVCDFGLARALSDITMTQFAGSPAYSAPECLDGNRVSPATDQYSLAVSYVELRTGVLPFDDESLMSVINAHLQGTLNLSRLHEAERRVIEKATARVPEERFASAREMVRALQVAMEETVDETLDGSPDLKRPSDAAGSPPREAASSSILITAPHLHVDADDETLQSRDTADDELGRATVTDALGGRTAELVEDALGRRNASGASSLAPPKDDAPLRSRAKRIAITGGLGVAAVVVALAATFVWRTGISSQRPAGKNLVQQDGQQPEDAVAGAGDSASVGTAVGASGLALPDDPEQRWQVAQRSLKTALAALDEQPSEAVSHATAALTAIEGLETSMVVPAPQLQELRRKAYLTRARAALRIDDMAAARADLEALRQISDRQNEQTADASLVKAVELLVAVDDATSSANQESDWPLLYRRVGQAAGSLPEIWEREELRRASEELEERIVRQAETLLSSGDHAAAKSLLASARDSGKPDAAISLLLAEADLAEGDVAAAFDAIASIENVELDGPQRARHAALHAAALLQRRYGDDTSETRPKNTASDEVLAEALDRCRQEYQALPVVRGGSAVERATRRLLDALDLIKTASRSHAAAPAVRDGAIDLTAVLQDRLSQRLLRETVRQLHVEFLKQRIRGRVESTDVPDFAAQQRDCQTVDQSLVRDGLITAAWAEALIENGRQGPALDRIFDDNLPLDATFEPYVQYVRLRVLATSGNLFDSPLFEQTLQQVVAAFGHRPLPPALVAPYRQRRAASIVLSVVQRNRRQIDSLASAALDSPFRDPGAAAAAYELLQTFDRLLSEPEETPAQAAGDREPPADGEHASHENLVAAVRLNLMLGAWFRQPSDVATARQLSRQLAAYFEKLPDTAKPLDHVLTLRVLAQSHAVDAHEDSDALLTAVSAYQELVQRLVAESAVADWDDDVAVRVMRELVEPALSLESGVDRLAQEQQPRAMAAYAALYGLRGELLSEHLYADWGATSLVALRQQRFDAFDRAIHYARAAKQLRPQYLVGRGEARIKLSDRPDTETLDLVEQDARAALKIDPASGPANSLLALVFRYRASEVASRDRSAVVQFMKRAEGLCRQAVEAATTERTKARYLTDLSNVYLWWANFATDTDLRQQRLEQAITTAQQALEIVPSEEDAHRAWGNAAEDLAWIVARERKDAAMADHYYNVALEQHEQATRLRPRKAIAWLDLGRAALRSATEHYHETPRASPLESIAEARQRLEASRDALQEAGRLDPSLDQVAYFLACTASALGDYPLANRQFTRALELGIEAGRREVSYSSQWARSTMAALSEAAYRVLGRHATPNLPPVLQAARQTSETLAALPPGVGTAWYSDPQKEAVAIRSVVLALEGKPDEAIKQLRAVQSKPDGRDGNTNNELRAGSRVRADKPSAGKTTDSRSPDTQAPSRAGSRERGREETDDRNKSDSTSPSDSDVAEFADINLYVAEALVALLDEAAWNRRASTRNRALSQAKRAYSLAYRDRGAITPTRRIVATEVCAMVLHQLAKRREDPPQVRSASRAGAKHLLTLLIDNPLSLYDPHEWMWREQLADVLIDELLEGDIAADARPAFVDRIRQHLNVAAQLGADREQIRGLREDLAKALEMGSQSNPGSRPKSK